MSGLLEQEEVKASEPLPAETIVEELLPAENSTEYWKVFSSRAHIIRTAITTNLPADPVSIVEEVKRQKKLVLDLQRYGEDSASVLPPYDVKRSQEVIDGLLKEIKALDDKYAPKKKFTFSKAAKASAVAAPTPAPAASTNASTVSSSSASAAGVTAKAAIPLPPGSHVISDQIDATIILPTSPTADLQIACQLLIRNNSNTTIHLPWYCGSVRLEENRDCRVILGPCATSVYLEGQTNCTIFAACHQLRIHNSHGCRLYVRCASHPIIEDCSDMGFAPYALKYAQCEEDMEKAGLAQAKCWDNVVDFRWHKTEASPNWFVVSEVDRIEMSM